MTEVLLDAAGRRRAPATMPGFHAGRSPRNKRRSSTSARSHQWVVARLTAAGALDPGFGPGGIVEIPSVRGLNNGGFATAVLGDGRIVAFGREPSAPRLTRLLPTGALDASFHGGLPVSLPIRFGFELLAHPDGFVDVLGDQRLVRYRSDGEPDLGFGAAGVVDLPGVTEPAGLVAAGDRAVLVYAGGSSTGRPAAQGDLVLRRITAVGGLDPGTGGADGLT